jgi:phage tail protein X
MIKINRQAKREKKGWHILTPLISAFFYRRIVLVLSIVVGVGSLLLLGKIFLERRLEQSAIRFPIESSPGKEKAATPESKPDLLAKGFSKTMADLKVAKPAKNLNYRPSPVSSSKSPPPVTNSKPKLNGLKAETKSPEPPSIRKVQAESRADKPPEKISSTPLVLKGKSKDSKNGDQKTITVKSGASIYSIAAQTYKVANTSVVDLILKTNPGITNPNKLMPNRKVTLPKISSASLIFKSTGGSCKVWLGTFLKPEYAAFLKGNPALQGKKFEVIHRPIPNGESWYRVLSGEFESRAECLKVIETLKEEGASPFFEGFKQGKK